MKIDKCLQSLKNFFLFIIFPIFRVKVSRSRCQGVYSCQGQGCQGVLTKENMICQHTLTLVINI